MRAAAKPVAPLMKTGVAFELSAVIARALATLSSTNCKKCRHHHVN
jgi:hypothetical protein